MKILSIDVGIKNLAYCLLELKDDEYVIHNWDVINLCRDKIPICKEKKKDGKMCLNKAKFEKNGIYYCKTHAKNTDFLIPTNKYCIFKKKINKHKIKNLQNFCDENNIERNKKDKKDDLKLKIENFFEKKCLNNIVTFNTNNMNMIECGILLKESLDNTFKNKDIDIILIENQIGPLALRMKMLQGMITQYFIQNNKQNIHFINASNKLKEFLGKKKTSYSERKKLGIDKTKQILDNNYKNKHWIEHFIKHTKKDDLADSFLQVIWFIKNNKK
tara:strand:+ start:25813 stop:26631 length:819 start_codon:yes stop_codon:yes gene_type:complete